MLAHASFLRASTEANDIDFPIDIIASGALPPLSGGTAMAAFTDALTTNHLADLSEVRQTLVTAFPGPAAERVVAVAATFQMMNRALDGVGAPVSRALHGLAAELGFAADQITR